MGVRQVHALVLAQQAAVLHLAGDFVIVVLLNHLKPDEAVVQKHGVADLQIFCEIFVGDADALPVADYRGVSGDHDAIARIELDILAVFQSAGTDLRALGVEDHAEDLAGVLHDLFDGVDPAAVLFIVAVREVQAHEVHA